MTSQRSCQRRSLARCALVALHAIAAQVASCTPSNGGAAIFALSRTAVSDLGPLLRHDSLGTLGLVGLKIPPAQLRTLRQRNTNLRLLLTQAQLDRENTPP